MKRNFLAGTALSVVLGVSGANAADLAPVYKASAPVVVPSWAGSYIGGHVGAATSTGTYDAYAVVPTATDQHFYNSSIKDTGFLGGGQIGYNWQTGQTVYGVEADVAWTSLKSASETTFDPFFHGKGHARFSSEVEWLATFRGRVGIAATPALLLYVTGGGAVAALREKYDNAGGSGNLAAPFINTISATNTAWGWTAGFGAEYAMSRNWSVKAEYLRVMLEGSTLNVPFNPNTNLAGNVKFNQDIDLLRFGANYRF